VLIARLLQPRECGRRFRPRRVLARSCCTRSDRPLAQLFLPPEAAESGDGKQEWLLFGPRPRIEVRTIALAMLWPVAWIVYILIYGAITKWYPYPFLDVTTHGYGRVIVNAVAMVTVLLVVTGLYWLGDQRLPATDRTADQAAHRTRHADRRTNEPSGY